MVATVRVIRELRAHDLVTMRYEKGPQFIGSGYTYHLTDAGRDALRAG